jgi:hypothetical protein
MKVDMAKSQAVPAAEFTRNFGRYRMLAQKGAIPVTSHGQITGYFIPPDEYQELERFRSQRRSFSTVDLAEDKIRAIAETEMDPRHDHLDALLDPK